MKQIKKNGTLTKRMDDHCKWLAKLLTIHGYRNSPIEDIHAEGRISQEEMKHLNKTIYNQIYTLLYLMNSKSSGFWNSWYFHSGGWGDDWDQPELLRWEEALMVGAKRGARKENGTKNITTE